MKYFQPCTNEHPCGKGDNAYTYTFTKKTARVLAKVLRAYSELRRPLQTSDMDLDNVEYSTWKQLKHFDLIQEVDGGSVIPTNVAFEFFRNERAIYTTVAIISNRKLSLTHPAWLTHKTKPRMQYLYEVTNEFYKRRHDFQVEKTRQTSIFQAL